MIVERRSTSIAVIKFDELDEFTANLESVGMTQEEDFMIRGSKDNIKIRFYPQGITVTEGSSIEVVKMSNCYLVNVLWGLEIYI